MEELDHVFLSYGVCGRCRQLTHEVVYEGRIGIRQIARALQVPWQVLEFGRGMRDDSSHCISAETDLIQGARQKRIEGRGHKETQRTNGGQLQQRVGNLERRLDARRNSFQCRVDVFDPVALGDVAAGDFVQFLTVRQVLGETPSEAASFSAR